MPNTYASCARCEAGIEYGECAGYLEEGLCCERCLDGDAEDQ